MKGGFSAQKDKIGGRRSFGQRAQPCVDVFDAQSSLAVLARVDVAMPAAQVALGQYVEKDVGGVF